MVAMTERHCCSITLIIIGDDLEPDEVTSALGWHPNQSWRRGENRRLTRRDGSARIFDSIHEQGGWKLWAPEDERELSLDDQFAAWMDRLQPRRQQLRDLHDRGWKTELNMFVATSESLDLPATCLTHLANSGVGVNLTFSP